MKMGLKGVARNVYELKIDGTESETKNGLWGWN